VETSSLVKVPSGYIVCPRSLTERKDVTCTMVVDSAGSESVSSESVDAKVTVLIHIFLTS
jgi:hypothetical protein